MAFNLIHSIGLLFILGCSGCTNTSQLVPVTTRQFAQFIHSTGYVTDAEKYNWSIVQKDVYQFDIVYGVNWRCPTGYEEAKPDAPVTQVSFQDAIAYCQWSKTQLPSYMQYWELVDSDSRPIVKDAPRFLPASQANLIGNVWEITTTENPNQEIRLAGGSHLCNENTCNGLVPERQLWVDKETGNSHISFAVIY